MKRSLVIAGLLFLLICIDRTCAQWTWQNPLPQGNSLYGVQFISPSTGWAVGDCGTLMKTTDGGSTWTAQYNDTRQILRALSFVDNTLGVAVGDSGTVLLTTDGGRDWVRQRAVTAISLAGVSFADVFTGYAVGSSGLLIKTNDGGRTWRILNSGVTRSFRGIYACSANTVTAVGDSGTILRTTDGGDTWILQELKNVDHLYGVVFTNAKNGLIIGSKGLLLSTKDGGVSWTGRQIDTDYDLLCISMSDASYGAIYNSNGSLFTTTNGGYSWHYRFTLSDTHMPMNSISCIDPTKSILVGCNGSMICVVDSGKHWTDLSGGMRVGHVSDISIPDPKHCYAVCVTGELLQSSDSGRTWKWMWIDGTVQLQGVSFPDSMNGFASGSGGGGNGYFKTFYTHDGGEYWTKCYSTINTYNTDIASPGKNTATAVGHEGSVFYTETGGASWNERKWDPGYPVDLKAICFADPNTCFAVGTFGTILKSTSKGIAWLAQPSGLTVPLFDVDFFNSRCGTAVGSTGVIVATTNGGVTWSRQESGTYFTLFGVSFADSLHGIAVGDSGTIISTEDGGMHWIREESGTSNQLHRVAHAASHYAIAVGYEGTILRRITNYNEHADKAPDDYLLTPGKPNPFTSSTVITFGIPREGLVRIDIYDILGRRIDVLVNETRPAGTYTIRFTPKGMSSGMYFCVMQSEGTIKSRRLVLTK